MRDKFLRLFRLKTTASKPESDTLRPEEYEFCPRCEANLTLQKGYSNDLPNWICKGCGEMLINPELGDDIIWVCDKCEATLNVQEGFDESCGSWICTNCGFKNDICPEEIYDSDDEYRSELNNPYKGMAQEDVLGLMEYEELENINGREDIILVRHIREMIDDTNNAATSSQFFVKKILKTFDAEVIKYLYENPIDSMPRIKGIYQSANHLIVIEEFIEGRTVEQILSKGVISQAEAIRIAIAVCKVLDELHHLSKPIIHRDVKPSNIIIDNDGRVYLLDVNVAKWYKEDESEDTTLLGTRYFAAPEQYGFGFSSSSDKTDIYAMGMLLNVMITGKLPKEEKAPGEIWDVIEKCIRIEQAQRYNAKELIAALEHLAD